MASTTTNLGLTKPAYSDDADISDINGNMDLIDAEAGRVRANVAANYDSSETYAVGDYCLHDGSLYKCSTAISSPEAWTAGHWTQIKITGELSALNGKIATTSLTQITSEEFSGSVYVSKSANTVTVCFDAFKKAANGTTTNAIIPSGYRPQRIIRCACMDGNAANNNLIAIMTNGKLDVTAEDVSKAYYGTLSYVVS